MNKPLRAYSLILFLIWPFSAMIIGIRNFDTNFGRKLLIAAITFLGFTALDNGDLERYASQYYGVSNNKFGDLIDLLINFQLGKFYTDSMAILFSVFENHHVYFAFLFGFYGYFLINTINLLRVKKMNRSNIYVIICFMTFALFFSVANIFNYAFYMGGIYFLYFLLQIILNEHNKKYFLLILLVPLFHIGLTPLLIVPLSFLIFKQKTYLYIFLLVVFSIIPQSLFNNAIGSKLEGSDTVFEQKFDSFGSEEGKEKMDTHYADGYSLGNFNYRLTRNTKDIVNRVAIPLLFLFLFVNRKKIKQDKVVFNLFNLSIACMAVTSLMLNISQGERFFAISGFMVLGTFIFFIQKYNYRILRFNRILYLIIPTILFSNLVSLIFVKFMISSDFFLSNFPYLLFTS